MAAKPGSSYSYLTGGPDEWRRFQERNSGLRELGRAARARTASPGNADGVVSSLVDIYSDGVRMQGTLWKPDAAVSAENGSFPAILMCHGWGGLRDHLDARFGRTFAKAGFVVLTFDYRTWGDSDGVLVDATPGANTSQHVQARAADSSTGTGPEVSSVRARVLRQVVDMDWQLADIEAALHFLRGEPVVSRARIGLWGVSQGGGHVLSTAARHRGRVAALVAQVPSCGDVGAGAGAARAGAVDDDAEARARGASWPSVPQGVQERHLPGMDGVPELRKLRRYRPLDTAHLCGCPGLVVDAEGEEMFDRAQNGRAAFEALRASDARSEYLLLPGRHYDAYDGPQGQFKEGTAAAVRFFSTHLGAAKL